MRHAVFGRRLNRDTNARKALLNNLATTLFEKGEIKTTLTKAKFARPYVEKLITVAKKDRLATNRRLANLVSPQAFKKLIAEIGPGFEKRDGGYTRIIKLNPRVGDGAPLAKLQLLKTEKPKAKAVVAKAKAPAKKSEKKEVKIKPKK